MFLGFLSLFACLWVALFVCLGKVSVEGNGSDVCFALSFFVCCFVWLFGCFFVRSERRRNMALHGLFASLAVCLLVCLFVIVLVVATAMHYLCG